MVGVMWYSFCVVALSALDLQPKEKVSITSHPLGWLLSKTEKIISVVKGVGQLKHSCSVGGIVKWCKHYRKQCGGSSKN